MYRHSKRGFTLIELLVVLAIISLISSFVVAGLSSAQKKSRNSTRIQEITAYAKAAELYQVTSRHYPDGGIDWTVAPAYRCLGRAASGGTCFAGSYSGDGTLDQQFSPHLSALAQGRNTGLPLEGYAYRCIIGSAGEPCNQYTILYQLEDTNATCAGGLVVNASYQSRATYCQIIECTAGKKPVRTGGAGSAYTCN